MFNKLFNRKKDKRVLVFGLDCASPHLIFDQFRAELPNFSRLMAQGTWGELESATPCITVPAWSSMMTSRDAGVLGVYGFRNRADYSYNRMVTADSTHIKQPRLWDILGDVGKKSTVLAVPQTYPVKPINGTMLSCFLTPNQQATFTYPAIFKSELLKIAPDYAFDVKDFRTDDKARLRQNLLHLRDVQFKTLKYAIQHTEWDFLMHVDIALDRIHHGFWRYHDPQHRLHNPNSPFIHVIRDYYRLLDAQLGEILNLLDDDVAILVVSDHGVKRMDGGICINEWLWREGWLHFKNPPPDGKITPFEALEVDWSKTRAWGAGGYYARVFLNIAGREPEGIIPSEDVNRVRDELANAIKQIRGADDAGLNHRVIIPQEVYTQVNGIAPDLMVYFGDLAWRAVGSLGHGAHYTLENDTGPDDANHDTQGMFILYDPKGRGGGCITGENLLNIAPTVLNLMGVKIPSEMQGKIIV
ncbi:MAG: alkaline phosphatase family protein [Anaerolineae bacterium]|nr:alkaline phosphatase family protein [Anaerolineae bacterium]